MIVHRNLTGLMSAGDIVVCCRNRKDGRDERSSLGYLENIHCNTVFLHPILFHLFQIWQKCRLCGINSYNWLSDGFLLLWFCFQNIIKKVSGQKFVYKFVSQPDPSVAEGARSDEEVLRRDGANPNSQSKSQGALTSACPTKSLAQVRYFSHFIVAERDWMNLLWVDGVHAVFNIHIYPQRSSLSASQKSSRNDYMKSGLYSTFTIQSLQVSPNSQPVKTELLLQQDPIPKVTRMPKEVRMDGRMEGREVCSQILISCFVSSRHPLQVCVLAESKPPPAAVGGVDSSLQVIVSQPSPCPTPALSPQVPANTANQSQVRMTPHYMLWDYSCLVQLYNVRKASSGVSACYGRLLEGTTAGSSSSREGVNTLPVFCFTSLLRVNKLLRFILAGSHSVCLQHTSIIKIKILSKFRPCPSSQEKEEIK